ncbi:MAG: hypothetical protein IJ333_03105 [Clostridia bacterium]|nr:hypothetical protein [Clostridia bacterium]
MKRKNWFSALMAVAMGLSMLTVVTPAMAEEVDYTALPLASTAEAGDSVTAYQINSVQELVNATARITHASNGKTLANFEAGDTIYLTADLDISTYVSATDGNTFGDDFNGFNIHTSYYTDLYADFDGLGHTISNYVDNEPFFAGRVNSSISNVTFENAIVTEGTPSSAVLMRTTETGATINNVHIKNSSVTSADANYTGGMIGLVSNGSASKSITITNSSITGTTVSSTNAAGAGSTGLFIGLYAGRHSSSLIIENCIIADCTVSAAVATNMNGLMVGYTNNAGTNAMEKVSFKNIGAFNNTLQYDIAGTYGIVTAFNNGDGVFEFDNVYAIGNVYSSVANDTTDDVPLTALFHDGNVDFTYSAGTYKTDAGVQYAIYNAADATRTIATTAETATDDLTKEEAIYLLNQNTTADWALKKETNGTDVVYDLVAATDALKPVYKVTFDFVQHESAALINEIDYTLYTDSSANLIADQATLSVLGGLAWDETHGAGYDWSAYAATADAAFANSVHTLVYTSNGDGTHTQDCVAPDCEATTPVTGNCVSGGVVETVAASYEEGGYESHSCSVCGNAYKVYLESAPAVSPIELEVTGVGEDGVCLTGDVITATVRLKDGVNIASLPLTIDYDETVLELDSSNYDEDGNLLIFDDSIMSNIGFADAQGVPVAAPVGDISTGFYSINNVTEGGVLMTVKFKVISTLNINDFALTATIANLADADDPTGFTAARYDAEGTPVVVELPNKTATVTFDVVAFTEGDVNSDGNVGIVDALIVLRKVSGNSYNGTAVANAANVDGDDAITTADAVLLMQYSAGWDVDLQTSDSVQWLELE